MQVEGKGVVPPGGVAVKVGRLDVERLSEIALKRDRFRDYE